MNYEVLEHTADVRIRVYGETLVDLLRNSALAMMSLMAGTEAVEPLAEVEFEIEGETMEEILVKMLGEILYAHEVREMVFSDVALDLIGGKKLKGRLMGEKFDPEKHELELDIKAATYHNLKIQKVNDRFMAEIVFDI
ncbi:MAG: archease [Thermodesulfobacteriota bacterium]